MPRDAVRLVKRFRDLGVVDVVPLRSPRRPGAAQGWRIVLDGVRAPVEHRTLLEVEGWLEELEEGVSRASLYAGRLIR